jgi:hydrogenase maturation protease
MKTSALVVAVGDADAGKDAVGPLILAHLLEQGLPRTVAAGSVGGRPDRLPDLVSRTVANGASPALLVLLDAVTSSTEPAGTVVEREIRAGNGMLPRLSSHDMAVHDAAGLLGLQLGDRAPPRIVLLGIVVGTSADGSMPDAVTAAIPPAAARARRLLEGGRG